MRRTTILVLGSISVAIAALASAACGAKRLPAPPYVGQPETALVQVPYPPPPARVEFVPDKPESGAVWIDGEWVWQGRRYAWKPGRWVKRPPGASYAPWQTVRDTMGTLYIAEGSWRDRSGNEISPPPVLRAGTPGPGLITEPPGNTIAVPAGHPVDAGANVTHGGPTEETRAPRELIPDGGDAGLPIPPPLLDAGQIFDAKPITMETP